MILATAGTTPWSAATPWAACRVPVTLQALCLEGAATSALDSVRVERLPRACSAPTVRATTTTTALHSYRVRGRCERVNVNAWPSCVSRPPVKLNGNI